MKENEIKICEVCFIRRSLSSDLNLETTELICESLWTRSRKHLLK